MRDHVVGAAEDADEHHPGDKPADVRPERDAALRARHTGEQPLTNCRNAQYSSIAHAGRPWS